MGTYKQIVWKFDNGGTPTEERSVTPAGSTLADCTFSYQPGSALHDHGIRIKVRSFGLADKSSNNSDQEKAFWEVVVLGEAAPYLHWYYKVVQQRQLEMTNYAMNIMQGMIKDDGDAGEDKMRELMEKLGEML